MLKKAGKDKFTFERFKFFFLALVFSLSFFFSLFLTQQAQNFGHLPS